MQRTDLTKLGVVFSKGTCSFKCKLKFLVHLKVCRLIHSRSTGWRHAAPQNDEKRCFLKFYFMYFCLKIRKKRAYICKINRQQSVFYLICVRVRVRVRVRVCTIEHNMQL